MTIKKQTREATVSPLQKIMRADMIGLIEKYNKTATIRIKELETYAEKEEIHKAFFLYCRKEVAKGNSIDDIPKTFTKFLLKDRTES